MSPTSTTTATTVSSVSAHHQPRPRPRCQTCKHRHLKCNNAVRKPEEFCEDSAEDDSCVRCRKLGKPCIRESYYRFVFETAPPVDDGLLKDEYVFDKTQTWVDLPQNLDFVDDSTTDVGSLPDADSIANTKTTANDSPGKSAPQVSEIKHRLPSPRPTIDHSPSASEPPANSTPSFDLSPLQEEPSSAGPSSRPPTAPASLGLHASDQPMPDVFHGTSGHQRTVSSTLSEQFQQSHLGISDVASQEGWLLEPNLNPVIATGYAQINQAPNWPIENEQSAKFLRHFIVVLSGWFDVCTPYKYFQREVPRMAMESPILLKAILSVSAWHLSRLEPGSDSRLSDQYYQDCLKDLINALDNNLAAQDDALLIASMLLHLLEELREPTFIKVSHGHLVGMKAFLPSHNHNGPVSGLRRCAFNGAIRQEVTISLAAQHPPQWPVNQVGIDLSLSPTDDETWTMRIILIVAEIESFCFGDGDRAASRWQELQSLCNGWRDARPGTFEPIFFRASRDETHGEIFPTIWFLGDSHAFAEMHHVLARILLAIYDPTLPRLGVKKIRAEKLVDETVREHLLMTCGIALGCPTFPSLMIAACGTIAICGDRLTDAKERAALLQVLEKTERDHAWPTAGVQTQLRDAMTLSD